MKNFISIILMLFLCLCFQRCKKEKEPQSFEEYVLEKFQKGCGWCTEYTEKEVIKAFEFHEQEFVLLPWIEDWDVPPEELLFTIKKDTLPNVFSAGVISSCGSGIKAANFDFKRNDKYIISGYGLRLGDLPGEGISEPRGGLLMIDSIKKVEE